MDPNGTGSAPAFNMNAAFREAQGLYGESAGLFVGLALVFAVPGSIAEFMTSEATNLIAIAVPMVVAAVFGAVSESAITLGALRRVKGEPLGGDLLATALDYYLPVMVALLLGSVAAAAGFMLLILPGVLVVAFIFFAIPVIVEEEPEEEPDPLRRAIKGLEQSVILGAGHRMEIFLMVFLFVAALVGVKLTLGYLLASAPLLEAFATWAAGGVISAFGTILAVTSYAQIRALHGNPLKQDTTPTPQ